MATFDDITAPISTFFYAGRKPDEPLSYQSLLTRRKIAEALLGKRSPYPKTIGEGLAALGEGIGERSYMDRLEAGEREFEKQYGATADKAIAMRTGGDTSPPDETRPPTPQPIVKPAMRLPDPDQEPKRAAPGTYPTPKNLTGPGGQMIDAPLGAQRSSLDVRNQLATADLVRQGVVPPDPTIAGIGPAIPASTATDNDNPLTAMAQAAPRTAPRAVPQAIPRATPSAERFANPPITAPDIRMLPQQPPERFPPLPNYSPSVEQSRPPPLEPSPITRNEAAAMREWMRIPNPDDPRKALWAGIIADEKAKRTFVDESRKKEYENKLADYLKQEEYKREARHKAVVTETGIAALPTEQPPPRPTGGYDQSLGTPESPQRQGPIVPPVPPGVQPKEWSEAHGKQIVADVSAVEKATPQLRANLDIIKQAREHPGQKLGLGALANVTTRLPGTAAYDFGTLVDQMKGKTFLEAYQSLRGTGQISEKEGAKAEQAQARLNVSSTPEGFKKALKDLEGALRNGLEQAQRKVGQPVTAWQKTTDEGYAPDIGQRSTMFPDGKLREYLGGDPANLNESWKLVR
jgi:hypothetical protein